MKIDFILSQANRNCIVLKNLYAKNLRERQTFNEHFQNTLQKLYSELQFQNNVFHQASSHNKCIQFKKLTEELEIPISESVKLYDLYIEKFNDSIYLFEDVENFLKFLLIRFRI